MRALLIISMLAIIFSTGCASTTSSSQDFTFTKEEALWQSLHVVDVLQTRSIAKDTTGCRHESNPITRRLIGKQPNEDGVLIWGVVLGLGHYFLFENIRKDEKYRPAYTLTQVFTSYFKFTTVLENEERGISTNGVDCDKH